jgi:hypothetical protein
MANYFEQFKHDTQLGPETNYFTQFETPATAETPHTQSMSDWIKGWAKGITDLPSWAEQATGQTKKDIEAYQKGGVPELMRDTHPTQALAAGFVPIQTPTKYMPLPNPEKLLEVGGKQINAARTSNLQFIPEAATNAAAFVKNQLPRGVDPYVAGGTFNQLDKLSRLAESGEPVDFQNIHNVRLGLEKVQKGSARSTDQFASTDLEASTIAKHALDNWLENPSPREVVRGNPAEVSRNLREGNLNYSAGAAAQDLDKKLYRQELRAESVNSGMNAESKIRSMAATLRTSPEARTMTPEGQAQAELVARGTMPENTMRWWSNYLGGGGGAGALAASTVGGLTGYLLGHGDLGTAGIGASLGPMVGHGLRQGATELAISHLKRLSEILREPAPLAQAGKNILAEQNPANLAGRQALIRALISAQPNMQQPQ